MTSQIKTVLLLGLLTGLLMLIGGALGGRAGLFLAFGFAMLMNLGSYWYSDKIVLRMYKASPLSPGDAPHIHRVVEEMAAKAGIPKPRIVLIPQDAPNAFATGRNPENAVVAVTRGIVRILNPDELRGVLAHELGHIANRDILIQTIATGARLSDPLHLAGALGKLDSAARQVPLKGSPATENMFIVNPFSGRRTASLFATHPPIEDRIARLHAMAQGNQS